ncbi:MAG: hypothetical protein WC378_15820 [Opitutaceae bacterium]
MAHAFGETLAPQRQRELEQAIEDWRCLSIPTFRVARPSPGHSNTIDYSEGNAILLAMLNRLRSFAE